jgi:hypothetical protein
MLVDDNDKITYESPEERVTHRKYQQLQAQLGRLRNDPTWPATRAEFGRVFDEAEDLYLNLTNPA